MYIFCICICTDALTLKHAGREVNEFIYYIRIDFENILCQRAISAGGKVNVFMTSFLRMK